MHTRVIDKIQSSCILSFPKLFLDRSFMRKICICLLALSSTVSTSAQNASPSPATPATATHADQAKPIVRNALTALGGADALHAVTECSISRTQTAPEGSYAQRCIFSIQFSAV